MSRKPRIMEIELLRGMAFLAVALQHAIAHFAGLNGVTQTDGVWMTLLLMAAKFAVPVFIFITGMVLFYNYDGKINYLTFIRKRCSDILIPYILWSAVYFTVRAYSQPASVEQAWKWVTMVFTGKNSSHLWYIVMIFQFYLVFPIIRYFINRTLKHVSSAMRRMVLLIIGLMYLILVNNLGAIGNVMSQLHIPIITPWFTTYADRNFIYFSIYFILGAAAGLFPELWKSWVKRGKPVYMTVFVILFGYFVYQVIESFQTSAGFKINFNSVSLLRPLMAIFLVSSIFVVYLLAELVAVHGRPGLIRMMNFLGKYSFGAYLIHLLMLRVSYRMDNMWFISLNITLRMMISFLICCLLSYGLTMILSMLPFGKWTVGISSQSKLDQTKTRNELKRDEKSN
ncbi:acyltransferase [Paenibacillus pini]|uniref:Integral membrane protein n=1 Tax=Paenibacillus pini JCM 16418 TaxID=1236976 RepID=W7YTE0_9BACL|nr:acyltransferase [Paenibacillus pini]GAF07891.1 integral membrane protein [Paenibacillus pini JCM 16418]